MVASRRTLHFWLRAEISEVPQVKTRRWERKGEGSRQFKFGHNGLAVPGEPLRGDTEKMGRCDQLEIKRKRTEGRGLSWKE